MSTARATGWSLLLVGITLSALAACAQTPWLWLIAIVVLVASIGRLAVSFANDSDDSRNGRRH
ncbi:hypothetical protein [Actinomyces ruminis]|uniref:Uncharacterized protein n=1 Tax=Actinomyces ruminis TaxID=1937003 RepID=A0ABX4MD36_9ACTO|nr:hypothetical protein [Actinomyces ruminis]PHP53410.1 hypothetical protein BW737_002650 [Actinomyces ruminis]